MPFDFLDMFLVEVPSSQAREHFSITFLLTDNGGVSHFPSDFDYPKLDQREAGRDFV